VSSGRVSITEAVIQGLRRRHVLVRGRKKRRLPPLAGMQACRLAAPDVRSPLCRRPIVGCEWAATIPPMRREEGGAMILLISLLLEGATSFLSEACARKSSRKWERERDAPPGYSR